MAGVGNLHSSKRGSTPQLQKKAAETHLKYQRSTNTELVNNKNEDIIKKIKKKK